MSDGIRITVHPVIHEPLSPAQQAELIFMACLRCGNQMRRGTQCKSCGAWCR